jgi:hypothetical protein
MSPEDRLAAFLGEQPVKTDSLFAAEVMQGVARRELIERLVIGAVFALAGMVALWACAPALNLAVSALAPSLGPAAGLLSLVLASVWVGHQVLARK